VLLSKGTRPRRDACAIGPGAQPGAAATTIRARRQPPPGMPPGEKVRAESQNGCRPALSSTKSRVPSRNVRDDRC